jgi:hypothetical protein
LATQTEVQTAVSWIKTHERLIIVFMVLLFGAFLGNKWLDTSAAKTAAAATFAAQQAAEAKQSAGVAAQQAVQVQQQYQAMLEVLQKQNAALAQAVTQRDAILGQQQTADKKMSPTQLTQRWAALVPSTMPIATPTGVSVTTADAQSTVVQLENVPVLTQNLKDETAIAANLQSELDAQAKVVVEDSVLISALNTEIAANDKACKAEVASVKADARKGKVKWFKIGYVAGLVSGLWLGHAAGL